MIHIGDLVRFKNTAIRRGPFADMPHHNAQDPYWLALQTPLSRKTKGKIHRGKQRIFRVLNICGEGFHLGRYWCIVEVDFAINGHLVRIDVRNLVLHRRDPLWIMEHLAAGDGLDDDDDLMLDFDVHVDSSLAAVDRAVNEIIMTRNGPRAIRR